MDNILISRVITLSVFIFEIFETIFLVSWHSTGPIISYVLIIAMIVKKFTVIGQVKAIWNLTVTF